MGRHAYLIMAHNQFEQLGQLLSLLDDQENDIYLHIDRRVTGFPREELARQVRKSGLLYLPRVKVNWGAYSQIACEMQIFRHMTEQVQEQYQYYHLLSGVDLPLKSQQEIHTFFDRHDGREFVTFNPYQADEKRYLFRAKYYFPFQERIGAARHKGRRARLLHALAAACLFGQKRLHINRCRGKKVYMGANWINITRPCMEYLVSKEEEIRRQYRMTLCADELFVQNILLDSPFREKLWTEPIRCIDWKRGEPYVFRKEDFGMLMDSEFLWARKFDSRVDSEIIRMIAEQLLAASKAEGKEPLQ